MTTNENSQPVDSNASTSKNQTKTGLIGKLKNLFGTQATVSGKPKERDV